MSKWSKTTRDKSHLSIQKELRQRGYGVIDLSRGIIFNFTRFIGEGSKTQDISFPCDRFWDWKDNLRAIALSMENLRRVERYGVFKYADIISRLGLPEASGLTTKAEAASFIGKYSGFMPADIMMGVSLTPAFKQAARVLHPDNQATGSEEKFRRLTEAKAVLEK
jgi:hypothetical protein